jgi:hypothetical protein
MGLFFFIYIHRFLFSKGDYDGAMEQYIRTIGQLEPSYVIRKVARCILFI